MQLPPRRTFLNQATRGGLAFAAASMLPAATDPKPPGTLPMIQLGKSKASRMIAGGNPLGGFTHTSARLGAFIGRYFTQERNIEFLMHCEDLGINTVSSGYNDKMEIAL